MDKYELHTFIARRHPNICQIAAVKNGKLVYSDTWNGYGREDTVHAASVTKSVFALLMGIAVDRGLIESVGQKVLGVLSAVYARKRGAGGAKCDTAPSYDNDCAVQIPDRAVD